jgi:uncharacterized phiE125 gp8 family phage protein
MLPSPVYQLVTAPATEPVTLAEVAAHVRQDSSADDAYLTALITVARQAVEDELNTALISQTWDAFYSGFPACEYLRLPRGPIASVSSVKYTLANDVEQTFSNLKYDTDIRRGRIVLKDSQLWPSETLRPMDPVVVRVVMGYGAAANVPTPIKQAILLIIGHLYEHREEVTLSNVAMQAQAIAKGADALLSRYRYYSL